MESYLRTFQNCVLATVLVLCMIPAIRLAGQQTPQQAPEPVQNAPQAPPPTAAQPPQNPNQPAPSLKNPGPAPPAQPQISPQEQQAFQAIQKEPDPAKQMQQVNDFQKQFPKSALLSDVDFMGGLAAWNKQDVPTAITYCQESLQLQPNNLRSLILVSGILPLPQALQGTDDQKQQQLTAAENDGTHALQLLATLQAPPNVPPSQFDQAKKTFEAQVHAGLGMAHLQKSVLSPGGTNPAELSAAEQNYKAAVAIPQPAPQDYFRLGEVYVRENKLDDALNAFTQAAQLGQQKMKELANQMIEKLKAQKAKAAENPPAAPKNE
ncbi:MAG: hypothetical protein ACRD3D_06065 [Terriglobia bacterium]